MIRKSTIKPIFHISVCIQTKLRELSHIHTLSAVVMVERLLCTTHAVTPIYPGQHTELNLSVSFDQRPVPSPTLLYNRQVVVTPHQTESVSQLTRLTEIEM